MTGITYFIQSIHGGPIKIGTTTRDPAIRLAGVQTGHPEPLVILATTTDDKKSLHRQFSAARIRENGEWFNPTRELLDWIADTANTNEENRRRLANQRPWNNLIKPVTNRPLEEFCCTRVFNNPSESNEAIEYLMSIAPEMGSDCDDWDGEREPDEDGYEFEPSEFGCECDYCLWSEGANCLTEMSVVEKIGINEDRAMIVLVCKPGVSRKRRNEIGHILPDIAQCFDANGWDLMGFVYRNDQEIVEVNFCCIPPDFKTEH